MLAYWSLGYGFSFGRASNPKYINGFIGTYSSVGWEAFSLFSIYLIAVPILLVTHSSLTGLFTGTGNFFLMDFSDFDFWMIQVCIYLYLFFFQQYVGAVILCIILIL